VQGAGGVPREHLLSGRSDEHVQFGVNGRHRPIFSGETVLWSAQIDGISETIGPQDQPKTGGTLDENHGNSSDYAKVQYEHAKSRAQSVSVFAEGFTDCEAESSLGYGYYVHTIKRGLYVFNGCDRPV
jgi:hypothetical protein